MTGKQLKNAILQLAIQGKLVPQDANDEPASALLAKIRKEKEQLVKAGKLKKKDLETTPISDEEKPFEIPESWEWVRLGEIFKINMGQSPTGDAVSTAKNGIEFHQGKIKFGDKYIGVSDFTTTKPNKIAEPLDLLLCVRAPVGEVNITERKICIGRGLCGLTPQGKMPVNFWFYAMKTLIPIFNAKATGSTFVAISNDIIVNQIIPLPPLAEQHRIVSKIEELMPLVEEYGAAQEKLNQLNEALPEALKKSILQQAIQGKLVSQDAADEPASVLLAKIRKGKEHLVKAGKIALSKPEKKFKEKLEFPFEIPNSWTLCSLYDVCRVFGRIGFRGYTKEDLVKYKEDGAITISPTNIINGELDFSICTYLSEDKYNESPEIMVEVGDILLVKTASCGKTALVNELPWKATINPQIALLKDIMINREYLSLLLKSPYIQSKIHDFTIGTSIPTFSQEIMLTLNIPLPPLAEQKRIVAKIEELMAMVDGMK